MQPMQQARQRATLCADEPFDVRALFGSDIGATVSGIPVRVELAADAGRVRVHFPGKPPEPVREAIKARGFKWAPGAGAWQCPVSQAPLALAQVLDR